MFEAEPYAALGRSDPLTKAWLELGYRHLLRHPIMRDGQLTAILSLARLDDRPFTPEDASRVDQLPIGEAVNMALALGTQGLLQYSLELIGRMGGVTGGIQDVATMLVQGLRGLFHWQHVSLFRVNSDDDTISLVVQSADDRSRLTPGYTQAADMGLLGLVAGSGLPQRVNDVLAHPSYIQGIDGTRSEMCLPVGIHPVRWILNVESATKDAFAREEQSAVEQVLAMAGLILDRALALNFNDTLLESMADTVIQTTPGGTILHVNRAAERLLGQPRESLVGRRLATLIAEPSETPGPLRFGDQLVKSDSLPASEVRLLDAHSEPVPVLLSCASLPAEVGGKVYVATPLKTQLELERMNALQQVFRQVASETRLPIALAASCIHQLIQLNTSPQDAGTIAADLDETDGPVDVQALAADLLDKARRQLGRADLPLERLVRLASDEEGHELPLKPVALPTLVGTLIGELPRTQASEILVREDDGVPLALAAGPELQFCASSAIAFLLKMKAQCDRVQVWLRELAGRPMLVIRLVDARSEEASAMRLAARSDHEREFALADKVMQSLMRRMRGAFEIDQGGGLQLRLSLSPLEEKT